MAADGENSEDCWGPATLSVEGSTYAVSRALYRRLAPYIDAVSRDDTRRSRQRLLDACESTMRRIEREADFARPGRFLFSQIRTEFGLHEQMWVRKMVDVHVDLARQLVARLPDTSQPCAAYTRAGDPCQREARAGSAYCPSHRHLDLVTLRGAVPERARLNRRPPAATQRR